MSPTTTELLAGQETLIASWAALASISPGATLVRTDEAVAAVFPAWTPLNNAILLGPPTRSNAALVADEVAGLFAAATVPAWALWVPSRATGFETPDGVPEVGVLTRDTTTLVMRQELRYGLRPDGRVVRTSIASASLASDEPIRAGDLEPPDPDRPDGLDGWALVHDGTAVAGAWSYRHELDCGIYAVGTVPGYRRRGFARALVEHVLASAWDRGASTASLQSTTMGQSVYASLGFQPVGRYDEWVFAG